MKAALDILTTAPEFDLVVIVVGSSARFYPELAVQPIIDSASSDKPIAVFLVPEAPQARAALGKAGVANFYTPEACADAVAAVLARRPPRLPSPSPRLPSGRLRPSSTGYGEGRGEGALPQAQTRGEAPPPPPPPPPPPREGGGRPLPPRRAGGGVGDAYALPAHRGPQNARTRRLHNLCLEL